MCVHRARCRKTVVAPHILEQPVATQGLSRMVKEVLQKLKLLRREIERFTFARNLAIAQIHLDFAERKLLALFWDGSCAPQHSLHPRQQLANRKRLGKVLVRS